MKKNVKKINLKKLTIARINTQNMHKIYGGTSLVTEPSLENLAYNIHCK
ncbi:MAG TPA: rSAM-modified peptide [Flavobacteriia bacterium]|jgi:natural product precursor|nr:rSAM-modified peptide [Flavobacteriia bacterium]